MYEPKVDDLVEQGRLDQSDAYGWSMGDLMDTRVFVMNLNREQMMVDANVRKMYEAIDAPGVCVERDIVNYRHVLPQEAPPHIHDRRHNWLRTLRVVYIKKCGVVQQMLFHVLYVNCIDVAFYRGNLSTDDFEGFANCAGHEQPSIAAQQMRMLYPNQEVAPWEPPNFREASEKKTVRNRAKRDKRKEKKRELAHKKAEDNVERERERKDRDDGTEGIHKGKKGCQQLAEEEAEHRRKELAEAHREWERLHPKSEHITVRGESHRQTPKIPKAEPTIEDTISRLDFGEQRGERQFQAEKKKADAHAEKLRRVSMMKESAEKEMIRQAGMRIAEAANPKAPPMTLSRKAGL